MADAEPRKITLPDVDGQRFTMLDDGPERLAALLSLIAGAKTSVKLCFYIFVEDRASVKVRDALAAAAGRGIDVVLLIDGFGGEASDAFLAPIVEAGGCFHRYERKRSRRYLLRNHQKMAIADRERVLIGGFNIHDEYFAPDGQGWRDIGVSIEGAAAARLADHFDSLYEWATSPKSKMRDLRRLLIRQSEQDGAVRWLLGGPTRELSPWAKAINTDLENAARLDMLAAYFAPYRNLLRRICDVAKRGQVRIATTARSDNNVTVAAARNRYQYLLPDARIFEYRTAKLHTKLYIIDDITYIGSANFDVRSIYLNIEVMLRIRDAAFASAMRRFIDAELDLCKEITAESYYAKRTLWRRIRGRLSYFLMSVLDYNVSRRLNFSFKD
ncbi:MAG: phosphatidylserine/phosphatidylglycerophosphate/cardiolipin synthase family protein [Sphingomonadaceae bacterium]|nr:phosphatidylserine/phosphatidylglycerophosphate/cardiolipin synthase family protein [Sphingomonadaceae bacterium]